MAIPTLAGFAAGEKVTATKLTDHTKTAFEEAVYYKPFCHMQLSGTQGAGVSGTTPVFVSLNSVIEDTDGMASTGTTRIIIKTAGLYRLNYQGAWVFNATGTRAMFLWKNGATIAAEITPAVAQSGVSTSLHGAKTVRLAVNDYLQLGGWQTSGTTINYDTSNGGCFLQAEWISL